MAPSSVFLMFSWEISDNIIILHFRNRVEVQANSIYENPKLLFPFFISCYVFIFSLMNALIYVDNYNFEAFRWNFSLSTNSEIGGVSFVIWAGRWIKFLEDFSTPLARPNAIRISTLTTLHFVWTLTTLCMIFTILLTLWNSEQTNGLLIKLFYFTSDFVINLVKL